LNWWGVALATPQHTQHVCILWGFGTTSSRRPHLHLISWEIY